MDAIQELESLLGIRNLSVGLIYEDGAQETVLMQGTMQNDSYHFYGKTNGVALSWSFTAQNGGWMIKLQAEGEGLPAVSALQTLSFERDAAEEDKLLLYGMDLVTYMGIYQVSELPDDGVDCTLMGGVFPGAHQKGLFWAGNLPQHFRNDCHVKRKGGGISFAFKTYLNHAHGKTKFKAESIWLCANRTAREAMAAWGSTFPEKTARPSCGWSTWDYYWFAFHEQDIEENLQFLSGNPELNEAVDIIALDAGWQHADGDWTPNYKFPRGMAPIARRIAESGKKAGIWTAPLFVDANTETALRHSNMLLKNSYGDPLRANAPRTFLLDPTHPEAQAFLRELYCGLYRDGFRYFKVDFLTDILLYADRFYQNDLGAYDALRLLLQLIRECIGPESVLLGCGMPAGVGPDVVDQNRIGIDIHNHWGHVEWAVDFLALAWWMHGRLFSIDTDYLIVRGQETSLEAVTNPLNPNENRQKQAPGTIRWRDGDTFSLREAETWANIASMSGGNIFFGDRLNMLNETGLQLLRDHRRPGPCAAIPLDLCEGKRPAFWLQSGSWGSRLTVINWCSEETEIRFSFEQFGLTVPGAVKTAEGERIEVNDGILSIILKAHASTVLIF